MRAFRTAYGDSHRHSADGYNNVAYCLGELGRAAEALPLYRKALALKRRLLGEAHPSTALGYGNLAACLEGLGRHAEALPLHEKALSLRRKTLGESHPDTGRSYSNSAGCLGALGRHGDALPRYRTALSIHRGLYGEAHPDTAKCYANLGAALMRLGRAGEALPLLRRSLKVRRQVLGEPHPDTAEGYTLVAACLNVLGRTDEVATAAAEKALAACRRSLGAEHPRTLTAVNNLAACLADAGRSADAERLYRQNLDLKRQVLGEMHPGVAVSYRNLANRLYRAGSPREALSLFRKAEAVSRRSYGNAHPDICGAENGIIACLWKIGRRDEAVTLLREFLPSREAVRYRVANTGFARALADDLSFSAHDALAVAAALDGDGTKALAHAEAALARGLLDDLAGAADPAALPRKLAEELAQLDRRLAMLNAIEKLTDAQAADRERLLGRRRAATGELARVAAQASSRLTLPPAAVRAGLPAGTALILWVEELGERFGCVVRRDAAPAWVKLPGTGTGGRWMPGDESLPERTFFALADSRRPAGPLTAALHRQRVKPLLPHLKGVERLLVVPTGKMAAVPVEALTDDFTVSYVPSGSAAVRLMRDRRPARYGEALILADPVFDREAPAAAPAPPFGLLVKAVRPGGLAARLRLRAGDVVLEYDGKRLREPADLDPAEGEGRVKVRLWRDGKTIAGLIPRGPLGVAVDPRPVADALKAWREDRAGRLAAPRGEAWERLPGTRLEARLLKGLLPKAELLLGRDASRDRLQALAADGGLKRYHVVHIATHGKAYPDRPLSTALILAPKAAPDDGRLTVEAVLRSWHLDADLVTLSACETGLGRLARGAGMLGFSQALLQKGARAVVLSRWKVDDAATALLMCRFYRNLLGGRPGLKKPLGRADALHEAKRWLRGLSVGDAERLLAELTGGVPRGERGTAMKALKRLKGKGRPGKRLFAAPYHWAAFALIGDPD